MNTETELQLCRLENQQLQEKLKTANTEAEKFSAECIHQTINKYSNKTFIYYTGFTCEEFINLCIFLNIPESYDANKSITDIMFMNNSLYRFINVRDQFLLVLMKLRNDFEMIDLAFRFKLSQPVVSILFNEWINYIFHKVAELPIWPHRSVIQKIMPKQFKHDFPNTMAILDCTEIKIQKPSSLKLQSQCFSDYKSTTTLKSLIVCDPLGSVMFASSLYTGSISDNEIFQRCGLIQQLKSLLRMGYLVPGDSLMADKGFRIAEELESLGLQLNIPPFAKAAMQMTKQDVFITKKIAKHRVIVDRCIGKIKNFKFFS